LAEALRDTAAALSSTLRFDEVLDRILANVGRVVPHDAANIMLIETDDSCSGGIARIVRCRGYAERGVEAAMLALRLSIAELPTLRRMVETGRPLIVPDVQTQPAWMDFSEARWVHSYAGVPIRIKEQIIGFLHLDSATPGFFSPVQAERLQAFADQAAVAVENARLHDEIRRHAAELEQRVAERTAELQTANERLKELDQLKNRFVANVSHELRTPLANIKTLLYLLEKGRLDKRQYYLATLNRESDLLQQIIEDLLLLSRLDQGKTQPDLASVDVNDLLGTLVADRTTMFADRGLTLTAELAPGLLVVRADARMLMQIATNLMTNAMNYTPRGGVVRVSTGVRISDSDFAGGSPQSAVRNPKSQWVTFLISDTGPGIAAEDLAHLCERFYRGEAGRQSKEPGTGLGLAICKELVERHGGQITVDSVVGQGTTFTVWLPKDE
jgi:signal transduction histidine kinase